MALNEQIFREFLTKTWSQPLDEMFTIIYYGSDRRHKDIWH